MVTARNYAAQIEDALNKNNVKCVDNKILAEQLNKSIHFAIPDNGLILNDELKGLTGNKLNLPYDNITLEFYVAPKDNTHSSGVEQVITKRFIFAYKEQDKIYLNSMGFSPKFNNWYGNPLFLSLSSNQVVSDEGIKYDIEISNNTQLSESEIEAFKHNLIPALPPLLEFLEALTCRNVYIENLETVNEKKNNKRIKDGKLPFYETKILVVDSSAKEVDKTYYGGTHASPKQHLRRGHIRRYSWGNIWINNMIVGKASNGVVNKSYRIV